MARNVNRIYGVVAEGQPNTGRARVELDGVPVEQADVDSITWQAYDADEAAIAGASGTLTVADVIFDTLQTKVDDPGWKHGYGYNFKYTFPASAFPDGGVAGYVELTVTIDSVVHRFIFAAENVSNALGD